MSDDRPSIAELQSAARRRMETTTLDDYDRTGRELLAAAPVLLEIAAAALRYRAGMSRSEVDTSRCDAIDRALAKVRQ